MGPDAWFLILSAAVLVLYLLWGLLPGARRRYSKNWIRDQRAPITDELAREVQDVRWRARMGAGVGGLVGLVVAAPYVLSFDSSDARSLVVSSAAMLIPFVSLLVGRSLAGLIGAVHAFSGPVRVAHPRASRLTDYVRPVIVVLTRFTVALVLSVMVWALRLPLWQGSGFGEDESGPIWCMLTAVALIWLLAELVVRRLVVKPLPSADAVALFWRDSLRADQLKEVLLFPSLFAYLMSLTVTSALPHGALVAGWTAYAVPAVPLVGLTLSFIAQSMAQRGRPTARWKSVRRDARRAYETV